ncbi:methyl-accepting chemotaxis protein [Falsiroseomonas sp. HW251]|uniref:methyl-accepting chemotaxis protein n=1 Tax=Falsiroseomonas sp. HW251 TaxID=3390998 RepID=UPI003D31144E
MRLFLDLSVGRKLAASALLAIVMLAALSALVRQETGRVLALQREEARSLAASVRIGAGVDTLREVPVLERDLLMAQDAAAQGPARARMLERLDAGLETLVAGVSDGGDPALLRLVDGLRGAARGYRDALAQLADQRARLIALRDEQLLARSADYDPAFEAISGAIGFDLDGAAQEEARQRLLTVHAAVNEVRIGVQRFLATGEEAQLRRIRRGIAQARVHGRGLAGLDVPDRMKPDLARFGELAIAIAQAAEEVLAASEAVARLRTERVQPAREVLSGRVAELDRAGQAASAARQEALVAAAAEAQAVAVWGWIAITLVLVVSGLLMARAVGAPLRRLAGTMRAIAGGDTGVEVGGRGRRDEIGVIADALEQLRQTARQAFAQGQMLEQLPTAIMSADPRDDFRITYMNAEATRLLGTMRDALPVPPEQLVGQSVDIFHRHPEHQRALLSDPSRLPHSARIRFGTETMELKISAIRDAAGDYAGAMLAWQLATEKARLVDSFEREVGDVVEAVAKAADALQASAKELTASAATSNAEAAAVAEAGGRANADLQSVAAAAEEMAASVTEIARRVGEAAEVANRAVAEARATDATVQGLSEAASRIGDVVRMIGDIAGQTNLLALNATIEAARAGEAGKGFAVVASEVKSLAGQTARATEEIGRQIAEMQAATGQAVAAIRGIGATVERTSEIATTIAAAVEEQGSATREIARSAAQVAEATGTVAGRIASVRGAAEETGEAATAMQQDSSALAAQAATLREKSGRFLEAVRAM